MNLELVEVLVPVPLLEKFSYLLPKHLQANPPQKGARVLVPFGRRTLVGVVWKTNTNTNSKPRKYKYIKEIIDNETLLSEELLNLADWAARYYHYPLGEVVSHFFTPSLRKGKEAKFLETAFWDLTNKGEFVQLEDFSRAPSQQKALEIFRQEGELAQITAKAYGISQPTLSAMEKKELLERSTRELSPYKKDDSTTRSGVVKKLNPEQKNAVDSVVGSKGSNKVFLLNGITGSGKTEVYIRAIQDVIKQGKQALVLIPEIGLAPQAEERFKEYFGEKVLSFHSAKTEREKLNLAGCLL